VEFAKKNNPRAHLKLFTNGSLLHKNDFIRKIIESPLDDITISLDATTKEEYEEVRKNLSFDQLIKNIKELYELIQKESPNKILRLSVLALKANEKSHKDFFDKMKGYADILEITNPHNFGGFVDVEVKNAYRVKKRYPCYYFWSRLTVFPDGIVSICGDDFLNEYVAGNLYEQTVEEIWKSKAFEKARELHLKEEFGKIKICKDCTSHYFWWKKIGD
jgi:radical SAM protein with 4Fe4S-binding SPASM domain